MTLLLILSILQYINYAYTPDLADKVNDNNINNDVLPDNTEEPMEEVPISENTDKKQTKKRNYRVQQDRIARDQKKHRVLSNICCKCQSI